MNELALFAGVGGGILGRTLCGFRTVCAVEIEPYCREVLLQRQRDRVLPLFPIWDDAKTFDGKQWRGIVDVITAGFPCQPFSVAGQGRGEQDERNMWPDTIRIIREVGPEFVLLENVPGLLAHQYFGTILGELVQSGYDCRWSCLGADDIGANHRRKRVWIVANTKYTRRKRRRFMEKPAGRETNATTSSSQDVANSKSPIGTRFWSIPNREQSRFADSGWWATEPRLGRVAHGVPDRVHRLKAIGNGQVPAVVKKVWEILGGGS